MILLLLGLAIAVLLVLRVPVAFAMLGPCLVYLLTQGFTSGLSFRLVMGGINSWPLLAVPLFIFVGVVANRAGMADRLFDAALAMLGRVRGGMGYVNIGVSLGFSWMSGAALADAAGLGAVEVPAMRKRGYPEGFSVGITAASTVIGPIMPPSIPAIVYSAVAAVSTGALFAAAVLPAALLSFALAVTVFLWARSKPELRGEEFDWGTLRRALVRAIGPMGAPVIILGGILGGYFTPTEAAAIGAVYMIALGFGYRSLKLRDLVAVFRETAVTTASIMIILGASALLGWILAREQAPQKVAEFMLGLTENQVVFLIVVNVLLILLGMVLEPTSALVISVPILLPIAVQFGVDPVHFGVIVVLNLMIGLLTPPIGAVLFVLSSVTGISVERVFRGSIMFLPPLLIVLLIVTFWSPLTTYLPNVFGL